jgi:Ser/Thr protein kinase RdoA (MazF antagonist)
MTIHWQGVLKQHWGIDASLTGLDGEYDLNFLASGPHDYVMKVMRTGCEPDFIDLQCRAFEHLRETAPHVPVPGIIKTQDGAFFTEAADETGLPRIIWLMEKVEGKPYAKWKPHNADLIHNIGTCVGAMDKAWEGFKHPALVRDFKWNLTQGDWIADHVDAINHVERQTIVKDIVHAFEMIKPMLDSLPNVAIHNDVNDYNIIVSGSLDEEPCVTGLIDLGDMCASPRICDLAIAAAYVVLDHADPEQALAALVAGYHSQYPLTAQEIDLIWPLLRMRLAVSVVNSSLMAIENPNDPYVVITQAPAWAFLETYNQNAGLLSARLRTACKLPVTDAAPRILDWLDNNRGNFAPIMWQDISGAKMGSLSVENSTS